MGSSMRKYCQTLDWKDPDNKATYEKKSQGLCEKLTTLDKEARIQQHQKKKKMIVTSEGLLNTKAYNGHRPYIWEINTEEGTQTN